MATRKGHLAPQRFNEAYARVIGIYSDPTDSSELIRPLLFNGGGSFITYSSNVSLALNIMWSRLLLCEIILPSDSTCSYSKLALVLRPQAMWLFDTGRMVSDFIGNCVDFGLSNSAICAEDSPISPVNPAYRYGDVIRIATLPHPLTLSTWDDGFTSSSCDPISAGYPYFPSGSCAGATRNPKSSAYINGLFIKGSRYRSIYPDGDAETEVVFYDKNVDGRTRFGGEGTSTPTPTGETVDVQICVGGVTKTYRVQGTRIG